MPEAKRPARRRPGRPEKIETDRQSVAITVWVTPADAGLIRGAAEQRRESASAFLAQAGRTRAGRPAEGARAELRADLARRLGRATANLNVLTRAVSGAAKRAYGPDEIAKVLNQHLDKLDDLGEVLQKVLAK